MNNGDSSTPATDEFLSIVKKKFDRRKIVLIHCQLMIFNENKNIFSLKEKSFNSDNTFFSNTHLRIYLQLVIWKTNLTIVLYKRLMITNITSSALLFVRIDFHWWIKHLKTILVKNSWKFENQLKLI